eukprot:346090-Chlamydomonas_euryale.AAC.12
MAVSELGGLRASSLQLASRPQSGLAQPQGGPNSQAAHSAPRCGSWPREASWQPARVVVALRTPYLCAANTLASPILPEPGAL